MRPFSCRSSFVDTFPGYAPVMPVNSHADTIFSHRGGRMPTPSNSPQEQTRATPPRIFYTPYSDKASMTLSLSRGKASHDDGKEMRRWAKRPLLFNR